MEIGKKQKEEKRGLSPQKIDIYDVCPSIRKKNPKDWIKNLQKRDRSESCL